MCTLEWDPSGYWRGWLRNGWCWGPCGENRCVRREVGSARGGGESCDFRGKGDLHRFLQKELASRGHDCSGKLLKRVVVELHLGLGLRNHRREAFERRGKVLRGRDRKYGLLYFGCCRGQGFELTFWKMFKMGDGYG